VPAGKASSGASKLRTCTSRGRALSFAAAAACAVAGLAASSYAQSGGSRYVGKPAISKVRCIQRCASSGVARAGRSTIRIAGRRMSSARKVIFHGRPGRGDNTSARVRARTASRVRAGVPIDARSGPVSVYVSRKVRSRQSRRVRILPPPPPKPGARLSRVPGPRERGAPGLETGTSKTRLFYAARRGVRFYYRVSHSEPVKITIYLIRARTGRAARTWTRTAQPGRIETVGWTGTVSGRLLPSGRYYFRLVAEGSSGAQSRSAGGGDVQRDAFTLYKHFFPIRGPHNYGGAGARFGAGRGGRSHQGQDVFARCGTRLVAARGGKVEYAGYQSAAGYYLVIDGFRTGVDYVYMHLMRPSKVKTGQRTYTGQPIGYVGETGNARGCHLHFELWSAPGWYDGGRPFDPLSRLRTWDRVS
jgi:murein DD-endopeptidase MepM/ murein hydrolase activator NlpD